MIGFLADVLQCAVRAMPVPRRSATVAQGGAPRRRMRSTQFIGIAGMLVVLLLGTATACVTKRSPDGVRPDHVRAIVMPYLTLMPFHIAQREGYFAEQNLEVEFIRVVRNQDIMTALATGQVDVAGGMLTLNELSLAARGARLRFVAALAEMSPQACPNTALVARRELAESGALDDPERIRDLVFDIDELIPIGYWTDLFLARYGLGIDDIEISNLPSPAAAEALRSGAIDVTLDGEPFVSLLTHNDGGVIWERMDAVVPNWVVAMVMFGPTLIDDRPEVGERLMVALLRAIRQFREGNTERNRPIVAAGSGLSPEQLDGVCWPWVRPDARIDPRVFDGYQQWYVERGLLDRTLADDELFEPRFIEHANAVLGAGDGPDGH